MARITYAGRATKITYGTFPALTFDIRFPTPQYAAVGGANPSWSTLSATVNTAAPTAGTITVAGAPVTLAAADIVSPQAVAKKILSSGVSGYTVSLNAYQPELVTITNTTPGPAAQPTVVLGTATNILFFDITYVNGTAITIGTQDDILVRGRTPLTVTVTNTGGTAPDVQTSQGTDLEQAQGALSYATALTLTSGSATITTPVDYIRLTTKASNTTAALYINR